MELFLTVYPLIQFCATVFVLTLVTIVVDDFTPTALISIAYPNANKEVSLGNTLKPEDTQEKPTIQITPEGADESQTYTIVIKSTMTHTHSCYIFMKEKEWLC